MASSDGNQLHYVLDASLSLAILDDLVSSRSRRTTPAEPVESIYFDTAHRDLARRGFQLRCQPSDPATGWQLSRMEDTGESLLAVPLNVDAAIPEAIVNRTFGLRAGRDVAEVARVRCEHTAHELLDSRGRPMCRLTDTTLTSTAALESSLLAQQWRTLTVIGKASPALLARLDRRLRKAGARPTAQPEPELVTATSLRRSTRPDPVGDYVRAQRDAMLVGDVRLRSSGDGPASLTPGHADHDDIHDDIHDTRVAVRRLRSTLRNFAKAFDPRASRELDIELSWYAAALGRVRDQQVLLDRLLAALAQVPDELILGPVATTISEHLLIQMQAHRHDLFEVLRSDRYLSTLDRIDALVDGLDRATPLRDRDIRAGLAKAEGRLSRRLAEARAQVGTPTAHVASHTARKAAKRARYAAELAAGVLDPKRTKAKIKRFKRLQDVLGAHQDAVVAADLLRQLGAAASQEGQNGFTFGLLCERELASIRAGRAALED